MLCQVLGKAQIKISIFSLFVAKMTNLYHKLKNLIT